jgi:aminoglycoside phosphotransferase (APT) family kinase protein
LVCHTDLCLENIVVRQGKAVAIIDFDLATPADPLFDIAMRPAIGSPYGTRPTLRTHAVKWT